MKSQAVVTEVYANGMAQIEVRRKSACAGDCGTGKGCAHAEDIVRATALNPVGARRGSTVVVESATQLVLKWAALLYLLPVALMLTGVLLPAAGEGQSILLGLLGLLLGLVVCYFVVKKSKKLRKLTFSITEILA